MIDLFSGIGGFSLAASWCWGDELEIVTFCEMDKFCQKVLRKHWPSVPIVEDVEGIDLQQYGQIDLITAGFPCQPFSTAKRGVKSHVKDFSNHVTTLIGNSSPKYAIAENVSRRVIEDVAGRFRDFGYGAKVVCLSASALNGWHKRNRWFAIAYPHDKSEFQGQIDAKVAKLSGMGGRFRYWSDPTDSIRVADGLPHRVDRLRALGNAIVPQVAYQIMKAIKETDRKGDGELCHHVTG